MLNDTVRVDQGIPCQACLCPGISDVRSMLLGNKPLWPAPHFMDWDAASDTQLSELVFFFWSFTTTMPPYLPYHLAKNPGTLCLSPTALRPKAVSTCKLWISGFSGENRKRGERLDPVAESVSATADRILSCDNEAASVINCLHQPQPSILPTRSLRCFSSSQVTHPLIQHRATRFEVANLRLH